MPTGIYPRVKRWKLTDEQRKKFSLAHLNLKYKKRKTIKLTEERRARISKTLRGKIVGKNHWNWQNGKSSINQLIRTSAKYKEWRRKIFERDNFICQFCGKKGGNLNADHIKQFAFYPLLRFKISNGRTLCKNCHLKVPKMTCRSKNLKGVRKMAKHDYATEGGRVAFDPYAKQEPVSMPEFSPGLVEKHKEGQTVPASKLASDQAEFTGPIEPTFTKNADKHSEGGNNNFNAGTDVGV